MARGGPVPGDWRGSRPGRLRCAAILIGPPRPRPASCTVRQRPFRTRCEWVSVWHAIPITEYADNDGHQGIDLRGNTPLTRGRLWVSPELPGTPRQRRAPGNRPPGQNALDTGAVMGVPGTSWPTTSSGPSSTKPPARPTRPPTASRSPAPSRRCWPSPPRCGTPTPPDAVCSMPRCSDRSPDAATPTAPDALNRASSNATPSATTT